MEKGSKIFECFSFAVQNCSVDLGVIDASVLRFSVDLIVWLYVHLGLVFWGCKSQGCFRLGGRFERVLSKATVILPMFFFVTHITIPLILLIAGFYVEPSVLWGEYFSHYESIPVLSDFNLLKYYFNIKV